MRQLNLGKIGIAFDWFSKRFGLTIIDFTLQQIEFAERKHFEQLSNCFSWKLIIVDVKILELSFALKTRGKGFRSVIFYFIVSEEEFLKSAALVNEICY